MYDTGDTLVCESCKSRMKVLPDTQTDDGLLEHGPWAYEGLETMSVTERAMVDAGVRLARTRARIKAKEARGALDQE